MSDESLWIFGYGSLVWRPAFPHRRSVPASVLGWVRRFWQGSTDHRGVPDRPGRVVTLISSQSPEVECDALASSKPQTCWGTAYEVAADDRELALERLDHRERGGYSRIDLELRIHAGTEEERGVPGLVYVADAHNRNYLGPASIDAIARQIRDATGPSGPNPQYVFELARSLRRMDAEDAHVFEVEAALTRLRGGAEG